MKMMPKNKTSKSIIGTFVLSLIAVALFTPQAGAQTDTADTQRDQYSAPNQIRTFGGPDGVAGDLKRTYEDKASVVKRSPLQSYYDWKKRVQDEHGFAFGLSGYWLYQKASDSLSDQDDAWGQIYRVQGSWTLFGRGTGHPGKLEYRIEHRSNIGNNLSPSQLSGEIGAAALNSGFGYSPNFDWDLAVFNWTQVFNDQTAGFALGRLAVSDSLRPEVPGLDPAPVLSHADMGMGHGNHHGSVRLRTAGGRYPRGVAVRRDRQRPARRRPR